MFIDLKLIEKRIVDLLLVLIELSSLGVTAEALRAMGMGRVVVSVSTSRSRYGLQTYQRLVSVSSREKLLTSRSRLGLGRQTTRSRLGLGHLRLVPKTNFRSNWQAK